MIAVALALVSQIYKMDIQIHLIDLGHPRIKALFCALILGWPLPWINVLKDIQMVKIFFDIWLLMLLRCWDTSISSTSSATEWPTRPCSDLPDFLQLVSWPSHKISLKAHLPFGAFANNVAQYLGLRPATALASSVVFSWPVQTLVQLHSPSSSVSVSSTSPPDIYMRLF